MTKKERTLRAIEILKERYPEAVCSLSYETPLQLLIAVRLSAQCTDERVNRVTPALFSRYKTLDDFAAADEKDIEKYIYSCGFYKSKAKSIVEAANKIKNDFGGEIPDSIEELVTLPGVGRKTANLIVGDVYGKSAVVVDTHCIRITNRLGLAQEKDPVKLEGELRKLIPPAEGSDFCHRLVLFGREVCSARAPRCGECPLGEICKKTGVKEKAAK